MEKHLLNGFSLSVVGNFYQPPCDSIGGSRGGIGPDVQGRFGVVIEDGHLSDAPSSCQFLQVIVGEDEDALLAALGDKLAV